MSETRQGLKEILDALPRVAAISPNAQQQTMWPNATRVDPAVWNARQRPELRFDLVVVGDRPEPAGRPEGWLPRVLGSCRAALVSLSETDRSSIDPRALDTRVLAQARPALGANPGVSSRLTLFRGDLDFPLVRIDDYPTGVRPILDDIEPIHCVLRTFEQHQVPYWLGIVPGIMNEKMFDFLGGLRFMTPAQHGYDHAYSRMSARLLRRNDPFNQRATVRGFNEFRWHRYRTILKKLGTGKHLLEERLNREVMAYIPPCNVCDRATAKALQAVGFKLCLSDKPVPRAILPVLASDFYGRSTQARLGPETEVICLHVTWEADLWRAGNESALSAMLEHIVAGTVHKRDAIAQLAQHIASMA